MSIVYWGWMSQSSDVHMYFILQHNLYPTRCYKKWSNTKTKRPMTSHKPPYSAVRKKILTNSSLNRQNFFPNFTIVFLIFIFVLFHYRFRLFWAALSIGTVYSAWQCGLACYTVENVWPSYCRLLNYDWHLLMFVILQKRAVPSTCTCIDAIKVSVNSETLLSWAVG